MRTVDIDRDSASFPTAAFSFLEVVDEGYVGPGERHVSRD